MRVVLVKLCKFNFETDRFETIIQLTSKRFKTVILATKPKQAIIYMVSNGRKEPIGFISNGEFCFRNENTAIVETNDLLEIYLHSQYLEEEKPSPLYEALALASDFIMEKFGERD